MKRATSDLLKRCGVPAHILGYEYVGYAVELVLADHKIIHQVTKRLYPSIAEHFDTTPSRVERAGRRVV